MKFIECNVELTTQAHQQSAENSLYRGQCSCKCPNCSSFLGTIFQFLTLHIKHSVDITLSYFIIPCNCRFIINLKLFTVMGISWILEIISTFSTNETVEAILDTYNLLIGVFIFFIFVFKRKVLYELKCRFGRNLVATSLEIFI